MSINSTLQHWINSKILWIGLIVLSLSMEGIALFFQYVLDEPPCITCIHFRLLFVVIILFSIIGLITYKSKIGRMISVVGVALSFFFMTERAYLLLGTERRFITGECGFALDFPDWIAVDKWVPWLFQPMTSCGYTPEILFGITMAESLMAFTVIMSLFSLWLIFSTFRKKSL